MRIKLRQTFIGAAILSVFVAVFASAGVFAVEPRTDSGAATSNSNDTAEKSDSSSNQGTFETFDDGNNAAGLRFGNNIVFLANNASTSLNTSGLMLGFGNQLTLNSKSEYGIIAGNAVDYSGETERDLFIAGNSIRLLPEAQIGRDVYAAANSITVETDIVGDFSATADIIVFRNATVLGNVNVTANTLKFEGDTAIAGTLTYNDDATVSGLNTLGDIEISTFTVPKSEPTAAMITLGVLMAIISMFIVMMFIILVAPSVKQRTSDELTAAHFGRDLLIGLGFIIFVPIFSLVLMLTVVALPVALIILTIYSLVLCLASALAGFWLGKLVVEKLFRSHAPAAIEALVGITLIYCVGLIPVFGAIVEMIAFILGTGLVIITLRPRRDHCECLAEEVCDAPKAGKARKPAPRAAAKKPASKTGKTAKK